MKNRSYLKSYTKERIKLVGRKVQDRVHLILAFNYGYKTTRGHTKAYLTLRVATGHTVAQGEWDLQAQDFTSSYTRNRRAQHIGIIDDVAEIRNRIWHAYEEQKKANGAKPSPDQIIAHMTRDELQLTPISLANYIRELVATQTFCPNPRTKKKYLTTAALLDLLPAIRKMAADKRHPLYGWVTGKNEVMLTTFDNVDWNDMAAMIMKATCRLTQTAKRSRKGVYALSWATPEEPSIYSINTLEKFQQGVKAVLHHAIRTKRVKVLDTTEFVKVSRADHRKPHLIPEEINTLVTSNLKVPYLEETRRLMVLQLFTGVAVSDLRTLLNKEVHWIQGKSFAFPVVHQIRQKTSTPMTIPLLGPALHILESQRPAMPLHDQTYNRNIKNVAIALGFNRLIHHVEQRANGKSPECERFLHDALSSHDLRRSAKCMLEDTLQINRDYVCKMMGHALPDHAADRTYMNQLPQRTAELLIKQAMVLADDVFSEFVLVKVKPI